MVARLGNVIYWLFTGLAMILAIIAAANLLSPDPLRRDDWPLFAILGLVLFGIGKGAHYILTPSPKP